MSVHPLENTSQIRTGVRKHKADQRLDRVGLTSGWVRVSCRRRMQERDQIQNIKQLRVEGRSLSQDFEVQPWVTIPAELL